MDLPQILPPEEESAAGAIGDLQDMGKLEEAWLNDSLSSQAVEAARLRNRLALAYIKNMKADRRMRTTYAGRILRYLEFYSSGVAVIILLNGFMPYGFHLEKSVATALVGSTAVAAIGLVGFIARGLFRAPPPPPKEPKSGI